MMITRIAALSLLVGTAVAAKSPRWLQRRRLDGNSTSLDEDEYFCQCPCSDNDDVSFGSALVWVETDLDITTILQDADYLEGQEEISGVDDETGKAYNGYCVEDMDVFDLLYEYGEKVYCDTECEDEEMDLDYTLSDLDLDKDNDGKDDFDIDGDKEVTEEEFEKFMTGETIPDVDEDGNSLSVEDYFESPSDSEESPEEP